MKILRANRYAGHLFSIFWRFLKEESSAIVAFLSTAYMYIFLLEKCADFCAKKMLIKCFFGVIVLPGWVDFRSIFRFLGLLIAPYGGSF